MTPATGLRPLRIGIVCPYSFDVPGGVQFHVRDLAEALIARGHTVSVLAPADDDTPVPSYLTSAGGSIPVRYNGAVARVSFGPLTAARVRRWLAAGQFDILHLHEPVTPSLGMLALWIADGPIVATFHSALIRSRPLQMVYPLVRQSMEKIGARIAVSEDARRTLVEHLGGDAVVIPNGVYVDQFTSAEPDAAGVLVRVSDAQPEALRYMAERGIAPGLPLRVISREPFGVGQRVLIGDTEHIIGPELGRLIFIDRAG